jgi:factor associated with neutral sphingomyelinase activation
MTGSWFGGSGANNNPHLNNGYNMKEAVSVLYPRKDGRWTDRNKDRSRFTTLLLEHGEKHLQDWAVMAYTSPTASNVSGRMDINIASPRKYKKQETTWAAHRSRGDAGRSRKHVSPFLSPSASSISSTRQQKKKAALDRDFYPSAHLTKIEGRLHLCSKSLMFEPSDVSRPIIRCPFSKMENAPKEYPNKTEDPSVKSFEAMTVEFESSRHLTMKANNAISPFESIPVHTLFRFTFLHSSPTSFVDLCKHLFTIWHNHRSKNGPSLTTGTRSPLSELDELLKPMLDRPFDPVNILDVRERVLTSNIRCNVLTPLQAQPGCMVVTEERLYFQPALGVIGVETTAKAKTWSLQRDLQATARRYYGLKDSALELFWKDGSSTLFGFERKHEREQVLRLVPTHESNGSNNIIPCHTDREFIVQASQEWQRGNITNYDYLLLLNSAAGRTVQDLSRYPVFPWIISDYESSTLDLSKEETFRDLSKPIGALNEKRLHYFQQRLEGMADMEDSFLYGTHYSAAGYVLY